MSMVLVTTGAWLTGPAVPWYPPLGEPVTALPAENLDAGSGFFCCGLDLLFGDFQESFLDKLGRPWPWHRCLTLTLWMRYAYPRRRAARPATAPSQVTRCPP
jgi:hypothetical protein